ncbi:MULTISPECIES: tripartite tricarboxylate transporter TctB family protein [Pseudothermotoga]|jgi:hypothetical protein|uniref:DUF1468 domain-containing protein n=1 Tax=Pseudothermotoga lettingae (strain ATCC BAA-301 / DSM 14385 / NBRC 107922 / TMO) TaxID=416591 RepID=A8F4W6_PSELT|nr:MULTISPECIES: tripartite tricarboxylate transporter TctB family protein [Pseudothermotoga]ABV33200.1 hypothetical protein Tlet_0634 [Pseudothermotoga lettingae TMO]KUK21994.1 MAG: Uncharacterized protein XD56_0049 [Pseudothermotoga lettingae]MDI3495830.1 putative tricarboxylic transport rane protein [Pseudothermotoga sp.]GLI49883.1 hypothetical protein PLETTINGATMO_20520 [Pseudothermotoga lettingae TMO]HBJ81645.1 tripartite tricarboxylate transporter TctB family protein [Pseudothermotoga sp
MNTTTKDMIFGIVLVILSVFVFIYSSTFPEFAVRGERLPGPRFFPSILAFILFGFGIFYTVTGLIRLTLDKKQKRSMEKHSTRVVINVLFSIMSVILFVPFVNLIGLILTIIILGSSLMTLLYVKWYRSVIYSTILAILIYLIFQLLFKIPLPEGALISLLVR